MLGARGVLFHRFAAQAIRHMQALGERQLPIEVAMELLTEVISQQDVPDDQFVLLPMRELRWLRVLVTRWAYRHEITIERVVDVERRLEAAIECRGPRGRTYLRTIVGTPDVLLAGPGPDEATVLDWKTGWAPPPRRVVREGQQAPDRLSDMGYVQQIVYGYLALRSFPLLNRITEREFYVMADEDPVREASVERWELERIEDVLAARVAGIDAALRAGKRSKRWIPVAGAHCATCPRPRDCPIREEVGIPTNREEAEELAGEWFRAGVIRDECRPLLYGAVECWGPLEIPHSRGRRVVGWQPNRSGGRSFRMYEPSDADESPFDQDLEDVLRRSLAARGIESADA
jgi:hypothetical protein